MRPLTLGLMQTSPVAGGLEATFQQYADQVRTAKEHFPDLTLLMHPEMYFKAAGEDGVPVPGELTRRLGRLAEEHGLWLLPGTVTERADEGIYNTAVLLAPDGTLAARYRKLFPYRPREPHRAGREFVCVDLPHAGRLGMVICYDHYFPEVARQLAWLGAELIVDVTASDTHDRPQEIVLSQATAITNQVFVACVNLSQPKGTGQSVIVDPEGRILLRAGEAEALLVETIDLDRVTLVQDKGSLNLSRLWGQLEEEGPRLPLPAYGGATVRRRPAS